MGGSAFFHRQSFPSKLLSAYDLFDWDLVVLHRKAALFMMVAVGLLDYISFVKLSATENTWQD